jgi:uncharacterized protein YukE
MGQQHVYVDTTAVRAAATRFDATAATIDAAVRTRLGRLAFDGAAAGRFHVAGGDALRRALDRWASELTQWSRASAEIAAALRLGADSYADAESRAAARVG